MPLEVLIYYTEGLRYHLLSYLLHDLAASIKQFENSATIYEVF